MAIINNDDIIAHLINDEHICPECLDKNERSKGQPLTAEDINNEQTIVCDRCGEIVLSN